MIESIQGSYGIQGLQSIYGAQGLQGLKGLGNKEKTEEEFLVIFYKELLKQVFKPFENEEGEYTKTFSSDLLVEQLALEFAKNRSFSVFNQYTLPNLQGGK